MITGLQRMANEVSPGVEDEIEAYEKSLRRTTGQGGNEQPRPVLTPARPAGDKSPLTIAEVEADLKDAIGAPAILHHLSRLCWLYRFPGVECPEDQIMTLDELRAWLPKIPQDTIIALWPAITAAHAANQARGAAPISPPQEDPDVAALPDAIELLHRDGKVIQLLSSVVAAWQDRVTNREPFRPRWRGSLPRLAAIDEDPVLLRANYPAADSDAPVEPYGQLTLPGLTASVAVPGCTSWLLWLFDRAGGSKANSRGAPWDMRLWVYAILQLKVEDRDGLWHTLRFKTEEVIGWLHPRRWANIRRDWDNLPNALNGMRENLSYVPVPGFGKVAMLFPSVIPLKRSDPLIEFTIRVPPSAANGDRIEWPQLIAYGAESTRLFRAYLAVTAWIGRSARQGHPITRQIAPHVLGPDGKPRRRKGGAIVRSDTKRIPNPLGRYVKPLSEQDLARMIGFDATDRRRRHEARSAFERLDADGVIDLQRNGSHFKIFGPTQLSRRAGATGSAKLPVPANH